MKKFSISCDFGGQVAPFTIYIGNPEPSHHPLQFQADWLSKQRGGNIPSDVMDSIAKLKELSDRNNVSLEELCVYALGSAQESANNENNDPDENSSLDSDINNFENENQTLSSPILETEMPQNNINFTTGTIANEESLTDETVDEENQILPETSKFAENMESDEVSQLHENNLPNQDDLINNIKNIDGKPSQSITTDDEDTLPATDLFNVQESDLSIAQTEHKKN